MALVDSPRFRRDAGDPDPSALANALAAHASALNEHDWVYCGYTPLSIPGGVSRPSVEAAGHVDNQFQLTTRYGFETAPVVVTCGIRRSRFAAVVFWEALHLLANGGLWLDIDVADRCNGTPLSSADFLAREYFTACLAEETVSVQGPLRIAAYRKTLPALIAKGVADGGWTFGILTAGPSPTAARMARAILALNLPAVEVIFCGPRPAGAPDDPRVRAIDLDQPEPRGWITRKKNLLAQHASHEGLVLIHDRYEVSPSWAGALTQCGSCCAVATFPHVYFAADEGRFPQRYPDYQLLDQHDGLAGALAANIYDADRIFHPAYDDFAETAFCCGGLYITRRSLWNWCPQDESLFHCEWEDISHGLELQRRGVPQRVNTCAVAESIVPHPLLLTRLHTLHPDGARERVRLHITPEQSAAAAREPAVFKPLFQADRLSYYQRAARRFNAIPDLPSGLHLQPADYDGCNGLSDFWAVVERRVRDLGPSSRRAIAEVTFFLSDTVYKWPNAQILQKIRAHERRLRRVSLDRFDTVVGWGTGSVFRNTRGAIGRELAYVVDSDATKWGTTVDGVPVKSPAELQALDSATTAVVVFSCFFEEISSSIRALGAFRAVPAADVALNSTYRPLVDVVSYFREIERYYPVLFAVDRLEKAA